MNAQCESCSYARKTYKNTFFCKASNVEVFAIMLNCDDYLKRKE